jgi:hypothetical protein|tara:strand:- start:139 stop:624 length:486 start_codon:yes stop_codon:yes gene_type:complete
MYKSKFLQNVLGEHSSKGSKVGFEDFEDTTPNGFSEKSIFASTSQNTLNTSSNNIELELTTTSSVPQTYIGMRLYPCTKPHRLKLFWSILGECIENRESFVFKCTDQHEANELKILTFSLVSQINDRWKVDLNGLELRAEPPAGKEGGVKGLEYSCLEKTT